VELRYAELSERFRTRLHTCKPEFYERLIEEHKGCNELAGKWSALCNEAAQVDASLEDVKADFSDITRKQVSDFESEVGRFFTRFNESGPGRGNVELPAGLRMMKEMELTLRGMLQQRDELVLAQKLFAMNITPYPKLTSVCFLAGNQRCKLKYAVVQVLTVSLSVLACV
jgi:dynein heavy chain, axonemal